MKITDILGIILFVEPLRTTYAQDDRKESGCEVPVREIVIINQRCEFSFKFQSSNRISKDMCIR